MPDEGPPGVPGAHRDVDGRKHAQTLAGQRASCRHRFAQPRGGVVFGIGERFLMERRAADLAEEADFPLDAFDLALFNFGRPADARATMGATAEPDPALRERVERALGL